MTDPTPNPSSSQDEPQLEYGFEEDTPEFQIWKAEEKAILRSHVEGYRGSPRKTKSAYVAQQVLPQIKACWNGRYDKRNLKKDKSVRKEWEKKKEVCSENIGCSRLIDVGGSADIHMVREPCGIRARDADPWIQL